MKESISIAEASYAAGLFDGEGHIGIVYRKANLDSINRKSHYDRYSMSCSMSQNNGEAISWLTTVFGGSKKFVTGKRGYDQGTYRRWNWVLSANQALRFLCIIRPYLIVKSAEADIAIEFQTETKGKTLGRMRMDAALRQRQADLAAAIKAARGTKQI